jgi:hypothetical protein
MLVGRVLQGALRDVLSKCTFQKRLRVYPESLMLRNRKALMPRRLNFAALGVLLLALSAQAGIFGMCIALEQTAMGPDRRVSLASGGVKPGPNRYASRHSFDWRHSHAILETAFCG